MCRTALRFISFKDKEGERPDEKERMSGRFVFPVGMIGRRKRRLSEGKFIVRYHRIIKLKDNRECLLRNGNEGDGLSVFENFNLTHSETDYMLSYPDENSLDVLAEGEFLEKKAESQNEVEILAEIEGVIAGTAGIEAIGAKYKVRHRAEFGISVAKKFWGLGIGGALLGACIECAKKAGYEQLELNVVAENTRALSMYKKAGFVEYGRNPKGFKSREAGFQELVSMRLEL